MKRTKLNEYGKEITVINTCAEGAALLSEELVKQQAPVEAKKKGFIYITTYLIVKGYFHSYLGT